MFESTAPTRIIFQWCLSHLACLRPPGSPRISAYQASPIVSGAPRQRASSSSGVVPFARCAAFLAPSPPMASHWLPSTVSGACRRAAQIMRVIPPPTAPDVTMAEALKPCFRILISCVWQHRANAQSPPMSPCDFLKSPCSPQIDLRQLCLEAPRPRASSSNGA